MEKEEIQKKDTMRRVQTGLFVMLISLVFVFGIFTQTIEKQTSEETPVLVEEKPKTGMQEYKIPVIKLEPIKEVTDFQDFKKKVNKQLEEVI